jgi:hypothetical protein
MGTHYPSYTSTQKFICPVSLPTESASESWLRILLMGAYLPANVISPTSDKISNCPTIFLYSTWTGLSPHPAMVLHIFMQRSFKDYANDAEYAGDLAHEHISHVRADRNYYGAEILHRQRREHR